MMAGRPLSPEAQRIRDYLRHVRELGTSVPVRAMARELQLAQRQAHWIVNRLVDCGEVVITGRQRMPEIKKPVCLYAAREAERPAPQAMFDVLWHGLVQPARSR